MYDKYEFLNGSFYVEIQQKKKIDLPNRDMKSNKYSFNYCYLKALNYPQ